MERVAVLLVKMVYLYMTISFNTQVAEHLKYPPEHQQHLIQQIEQQTKQLYKADVQEQAHTEEVEAEDTSAVQPEDTQNHTQWQVVAGDLVITIQPM